MDHYYCINIRYSYFYSCIKFFFLKSGVVQVQTVLVIPLNYSAVWLTWVRPPFNNFPPLLYYTVHYTSINSTMAINFTSNITYGVIGGLHSSIHYDFRISMVTECGEGPFLNIPGISNNKIIMIMFIVGFSLLTKWLPLFSLSFYTSRGIPVSSKNHSTTLWFLDDTGAGQNPSISFHNRQHKNFSDYN